MLVDWRSVQTKQEQVAKVITNEMRNEQLAHAYLFVGQRGTGKLETATHLARSFFCTHRNDIEPCGTCSDCRRIDSGNHPDLMIVRPEGRSIKKAQVGDLIKAFTYRGVESERKFFIIEQADLLTAQAANSLLKFIEEPQGATIAVLLTEHRHQLLDTVVSRCQVLTFSPLNSIDVEAKIVQMGIAPTIAKTVAAMTYDLEDAGSLGSDEWFAKARSIVLHFMEDLFNKPDHAIITLYEQFITHFTEVKKVQIGLDLVLIWFRDLLNLHLDKPEAVVYTDQLERLKQQVLLVSLERTANSLSLVLEAKKRLSSNGHPLIVMEQLALRLQEGAENHV